MVGAILIVHVIVCFVLIFIVLIQTGKGADIGAAFGGTSTQTLFGSGSGNTFFNKLTVSIATLFMITCFLLAYFSTRPATSTIMKKTSATKAVTVNKETAKKASPTAAQSSKEAAQVNKSKTAAEKTAGAKAVSPATVPKKNAPVTGKTPASTEPSKR